MPRCRTQPLPLAVFLLLPTTTLAGTADPVEIVVDCAQRPGRDPTAPRRQQRPTRRRRTPGPLQVPQAGGLSLHAPARRALAQRRRRGPARGLPQPGCRPGDCRRATTSAAPMTTSRRLSTPAQGWFTGWARASSTAEETSRPPATRHREVGGGLCRHRPALQRWLGAGFRDDIRYWEIWNEPDNRPAMWTGDDEDYFRLYATTARAIKQRWPAPEGGGAGCRQYR